MDGGSSHIRSLGQYRLEPFLKCQAAADIDYAIVSHGDSDHISGLKYLFEECPEIRIWNLILPDYDREGEVYGGAGGAGQAPGGRCPLYEGGRLSENGGFKALVPAPVRGF